MAHPLGNTSLIQPPHFTHKNVRCPPTSLLWFAISLDEESPHPSGMCRITEALLPVSRPTTCCTPSPHSSGHGLAAPRTFQGNFTWFTSQCLRCELQASCCICINRQNCPRPKLTKQVACLFLLGLFLQS